jgi:hypothetical protein
MIPFMSACSLWSNSAPREDGACVGIRDLGTPAGTNSRAWGINGAGQAVGTFYGVFPNTPERAVLYQSGVVCDLNRLIPAGSGWLLCEARGIRDAGQILAQGRSREAVHALVLTPSRTRRSAVLSRLVSSPEPDATP